MPACCKITVWLAYISVHGRVTLSRHCPHCSSWIAPLSQPPQLFSFDDFIARTLRHASPAEAWPEEAVAEMMARHPDLKLAAVLIPVIASAPHASVLFTRRADHLSTHAGQISFPGGKLEASDASPIETALREAEEEIGLDRRHVRPLGFLDPHLTGTGFQIVPVLAAVHPPFTLTLDASEVAETFEAPLDFLMTAANYQEHRIEWRGQPRVFNAVQFGERFIWGATAAILLSVYERLYRECRASS